MFKVKLINKKKQLTPITVEKKKDIFKIRNDHTLHMRLFSSLPSSQSFCPLQSKFFGIRCWLSVQLNNSRGLNYNTIRNIYSIFRNMICQKNKKKFLKRTALKAFKNLNNIWTTIVLLTRKH